MGSDFYCFVAMRCGLQGFSLRHLLQRMAAERHGHRSGRLERQPQGNENQQKALEAAHGDKY